MANTFIAGYWKNRPQSVEESAKEIAFFLKELQALDKIFSSLKLPANTKKEAMGNSFEATEDNVFEQLVKGRKKNEIDTDGFCAIGYSLRLFDELNENQSLVVNCSLGKTSKHLKNNCYLDLKGITFDPVTNNKLQKLLIDTFKPDTFRNE